MADSTAPLPETVACPLCLGRGELTRTEILERLGMRDFARVAQLSAEEAIRLLTVKEEQHEQGRWMRFEAELSKRVAQVTGEHHTELQRVHARMSELAAAQRLAQEQKAAEVAQARAALEAALGGERAKANDLRRQLQDYLQEITSLRERNQALDFELAKTSRVGRKEEIRFSEEAKSWRGVWVSEKLPRNGDYTLAFADALGNATEPHILVDVKDKAVSQADIRKLVRDAKRRGLAMAALVTRDDSQLRHADRQRRWEEHDGIWLLRSTRAWLPRDLEVLRPLFERMRADGPDFLRRNAALADEVRRTLGDIDEIEGELNKAAIAVEKAQSLTTGYRARLVGLCDSAAAGGKTPARPQRKNGKASVVNGGGTGGLGQQACDLDSA